MFKPFPDVVAKPTCGSPANTNYSINWEDIARWAVEHGDIEEPRGGPYNAATGNTEPPIDWSSIADSFMRDTAAENVPDDCDADAINESVRAFDRSVPQSQIHFPSENMSHLAANGYQEFPSPIAYRERARVPERPQPRTRGKRQCSYLGNSDYNRSKRDSDFYDTPVTSMSSIPNFSCMEDVHNSTQEYRSDIMSYLEGRAERNRPNSMAEGYHFPGRAYGRADNSDEYKLYASTPKKKQRTTRAETFEMVDGSKMFNVTFEECLAFHRRLRHISDVRDGNGCQIMHINREIDEEANGPKHRIDIARRWLDLDQSNEED